MTRVLILNGPNLNLLGLREPEIYGRTTLDEICGAAMERGRDLGLDVICFQSNHEGALIDRLHERDFDWAIVNAAGLTHTSVSLRDALLAVHRPFIEVHLSDPWQREEFRKVNYLHDIAEQTIAGRGAAGYLLALEAVAHRVGSSGSAARSDGGASGTISAALGSVQGTGASTVRDAGTGTGRDRSGRGEAE